MVRRGWLAGGLLTAGCFFQPELGPAPADGSSEAESGAATAGAGTEAPTPTTGATGGPTSESSGGGAVCGDEVIEGDEECDEGAANGGGNRCREDCRLSVCGDGYVVTADEGCDDGNLDDDDGCSQLCQVEVCGDGIKNGREGCDDGNQVDDDGCTNACELRVCGDGVVQSAEECDDGNASDADSCSSACTLSQCGDGIVWIGVEECDDPGPTCQGCERVALRVFVSSMAMVATQIGGLVGADVLCQGMAANAGLGGAYVAWLSTTSVDARDRLGPTTLPYVLVDGTVVAASTAEFTSDKHEAPIDVDEHGNIVFGNPNPCGSAAVWTGSRPDGVAADKNCDDWTNNLALGQGGVYTAADSAWSGCTYTCDTVGRLYCLEQP